jgi:hypothetical protein
MIELTVTTRRAGETRTILENLAGVRIVKAVRLLPFRKSRFHVTAVTRGNVDTIRKAVLTGTDVSHGYKWGPTP